MSRSFQQFLKLSVPVLLASTLLSGCGSGGSGSADLNQGGSVSQPPPPVASTETFDFASATSWFVSGTPPTHARFSGGTATATGAGYWIIPEGATGVVDFGTPADAVRFSTQDDFTPTAGAGVGAQKTGASGQVSVQAVKPPFDRNLYVRGSMNDWAADPAYQLVEVAENVKSVSVNLEAGDYNFKISDPGWSAGTNCGWQEEEAVTIGVPLALNCDSVANDIALSLPRTALWKFTLNVTGDPTVTVAEDTGGGGGGGDPEPEEDSTVVRIHYVTVVATAAGPAGVTSVEETKGLGSLAFNIARRGGESRVYKVEIENLGTNGDIGVADFSWTSDAQFALATQTVDIFYTIPSGTGSATGLQVVVGGTSYPCTAAPAGATYSCVARNVVVTPYANATMEVRNADGSTRDSIIFNGGSGAEDVFAYSGSTYASTGTPAAAPTISNAAAHWVNEDTILYDVPTGTARVELLYSPDGTIASGPQGFTGTFQTIALTGSTNPQPAFNEELWSLDAWEIGSAAVANAREIARGQLVVVSRDSRGIPLAATYVQSAGAIDALYADAAYDETLGVSYDGSAPSLAVWAPTALRNPGLSVNIYDADGALLETAPMTLDPDTGIWRVTGTADWDRRFYTISLRVYSYAAKAMVNNEVTDPYSVSLATDSVRSQFVNLNDSDLKPAGWDDLQQPALAAPEDIVVYELHVRDFSVADNSVPAGDRGKFTAFDIPGTAGRAHLQQLAQAGLSHVHVLPAFDIATIRENPADRVDLDDPVEDLCAANPAAANLCVSDAGKTIRQAMADAVAVGWLTRPQQITNWMRAIDGFNWGYDPFHFGAPEGSYSTNPNGETRILEFRRMVKGLNDIGLRTIMDVVYNHTNASGQNTKSVLDKLVPGYYHRRDNTTGNVLRDSCCDDTAAEFRMMEKLMVDTGVTWVRDYKVSGFRFDIMSFHPLASMTRFRDAVQAVDPTVYIYGEGWNFGAIENDDRFLAARQANLGGTGIGSFSDRIRDPIKGGGCCDGGDALVKNQGFVNGWFYDPNAMNTGSTAERQALITSTDNIRVWLAGGLEDYQLQNAAGATVTGAAIDYGNQPSGYTVDPQEAINYVEKHDNQTLWDFGAYRHPDTTSLADRVRAHNVGLSIILLGQGVPFLHAGSDILRSKSGDRDSYDSGDWFNELDWTLSGTKWAQGLPIADKNEPMWPTLEAKYQVVPRPDTAAQQRAFDNFREMLQIRRSSGLFRLRDAAQIKQRVKFYNTGPTQIPGLIAMGIDGCTNPNEPAPEAGAIMVLFNASDTPQTLPLMGSEAWALHPVLAASTDPVVRTASHDANGFHVPARTTAVFRRASQTSCAPYAVDMFVRGGFNDWGNPSPTPQWRLQFLGGTGYSVSAPIGAAGSYEFKIADASWSDATNCGAGAAGGSVRLGVPLTLRCAAGTGNLGMSAPTAGDYTFALEATDPANPVLTVTKSPPTPLTLYVRGGFNDWGNGPAPTAPLGWDGVSTYRAVVAGLAAQSYEFKVADNDWGGTTGGATNCGGASGGTSVAIGTPYTLTCASSSQNMGITFPSAGSYLFAVNWANPAAPQLTVERLPVDAAVFVRGIGGDWGDGAANQMSYLGGGVYSLNKTVTAASNEFKIASSDWATVNCGAGTAGNTVTVGSPLTLACGDGTGNLTVTPATTGTYTFRFRRDSATAGELTVTGP